MNKLYIIRHGQTDWNVKKLLQGKTDIELNEEGIRQDAEIIAKFKLSNNFNYIFF